MNDDLVTIEKKATNKFGIALLIVVILILLGGGAYYYLTNKNLITFDFKFPWQQEKKIEDDPTEEEVSTQKSSKPKNESPLERVPVEISSNSQFYNNQGISVQVANCELKDNSYIIKLIVANSNSPEESGPFVFKVRAVTLNRYQIPQDFTLAVNPGEMITHELTLSSQELDKNRINSFSKLILIGDVTFQGTTKGTTIGISGSSDNGSNPKIKPIALLDTINSNLNISYYKKVETDNSTKVYFLFENNSGKRYTYYINRLMVDGKDVDTSIYNETIYERSIYIPIIDLPKSLLSQNKKARISFVVMAEDKSVYKSVEKEFDL